MTADTLKKIGMNVELQETDWGTVVQRRASMEPVEKGGWSVFHTFSSSVGVSTPATHPLINGRGIKGWFGWWDNAEARSLTTQWLTAPDAAGQDKAARALSHVAMTDVGARRSASGTAKLRSAAVLLVFCRGSRHIPGTSGRPEQKFGFFVPSKNQPAFVARRYLMIARPGLISSGADAGGRLL